MPQEGFTGLNPEAGPHIPGNGLNSPALPLRWFSLKGVPTLFFLPENAFKCAGSTRSRCPILTEMGPRSHLSPSRVWGPGNFEVALRN